MRLLIITCSLVLTTGAYHYFYWIADPFLVEILDIFTWVSLCALLYAELQCERRHKYNRLLFEFLRRQYVEGEWSAEMQGYLRRVNSDIENPPWYVRWGGR